MPVMDAAQETAAYREIGARYDALADRRSELDGKRSALATRVAEMKKDRSLATREGVAFTGAMQLAEIEGECTTIDEAIRDIESDINDLAPKLTLARKRHQTARVEADIEAEIDTFEASMKAYDDAALALADAASRVYGSAKKMREITSNHRIEEPLKDQQVTNVLGERLAQRLQSVTTSLGTTLASSGTLGAISWGMASTLKPNWVADAGTLLRNGILGVIRFKLREIEG